MKSEDLKIFDYLKVAEKIGKKGNYVKIVSVNFRVARLDERVTKTKGFKVSRVT